MDTTLADPTSGPIGHLLDGRYRVGSRIARGGMATVYVATDTRLDRTVALKIMHAELAGDEDFVRRFIGEAKSVARLSHPNVVGVFDQGSDGRNLYLAMEYVPGRTLRELLSERGRLGPREALDIMIPVLSGLSAAHESGIVHRDVKPENVLLASDGRVKVVDFGLARAIAAASHTRTGMIMGTVAYLAPEQVARSVADTRTDVYSAGILLFELLTGTQPHTGDSPLAVAYKHVNDVVPAPSGLVGGLPPAFDALVALATSRDPERRPADASQFLRAVSDVRQGLTGSDTDFPPPSGQHWPGATSDPPQGIWPEQPASQSLRQSHTLVASRADLDDGGYDDYYRAPGTAEPGPRRRSLSRRLGYMAIGVAAALVIGGVILWQTATRYASVPRVAGLTVSAAAGELRHAGFAVRTGAPMLDNQVAKGHVIRTVPTMGGRAAEGATITLIASAGPHMIMVPAVAGQPLAGAQAALQNAGLRPGTVTQQASATIAAGTVISTNPAAGTSWPQPAPVAITVSAGPPLPDFTGQAKQTIEAWAQQNNISLNEQPDSGSNQPLNIITRQSPAAGSPMTPGEVVTIYVSTGPPMVAIPNVDGTDLGQARSALQQLGFSVNVIRVGPLNTVFNYSPTGQAAKGSTITLWAGLPHL